ncbi:MAG: acetyl-CoA carboxylase carboxyltransferase subunit alpha [Candidatus Baltobacteraceae bacterium]
MNVIVEREKKLLELEKTITDLRAAATTQPSLSAAIESLQQEYKKIQRDIFGSMTPWQKVNMSRHPERPRSSEYIEQLESFDQLHGDRHFRDDPAVLGGLAKLGERSVMVIAQQRGRDTKENLKLNFGMVTPEGYRKVKRLVDLASRLGIPVVTFVDTKGADPGIGSEERAQSEAIAQCLYSLTVARVPIVATVVGEGGSGGALALAIADHVIMLEHSTYSVASPEGCAAILWGDAAKAEEAASHLKLTSQDLLGFGIIDEVIPEPLGGAHRDAPALIATTLQKIEETLARLSALSAEDLVEERYRKYRRIGAWQVERQKAVAISG